VILCMSSVPPISRDALTHHLRVPQLYIDHGGIVELPSIEFSYYPMNLDLLYLLPLLMGNDIIPKYIHFAFALGTASMLFFFLRSRLGSMYGWFGAFFFLSLPIVVKLSITIYVDLGLVFFFTATLIQLIKWTENDHHRKHLFLAGIFCGLGLGTKYNGLIGLLLFTIFIPILRLRTQYYSDIPPFSKERRRIAFFGFRMTLTDVICFVFAALIVFSPWMLRNIYWQGNPLFPLFDGFFNPGHGSSGSVLDPLSTRRVIFGESLWNILAVPIRIFFQGEDNDPQLFDGRLSPFLFILSLVGSVGIKWNTGRLRCQKSFLLAFSLLYILITFFQTNMRIRYVLPIVPPLIILSAYGIQSLITQLKANFSGFRYFHNPIIIGCFSLLLIAVHMPYVYGQWKFVDPLPFLCGKIDSVTYITKYRPEYELYRYGNKVLPQHAKVLALFLGNRGYRFKRNIIFDIHGFQMELEKSDNQIELNRDLRNKAYSHLMINHALFNTWAQENFSNEKQQSLALFFKNYTRPIYTTRTGHILYALLPEKASDGT
jgi:hypothetical protein